MKVRKYLTSQSIASICSRFAITPPDEFSQDWELEYCDPERTGEWVAAYESATLDEDEKFALMALILSSLDEAIDDGQQIDALWIRIAKLLSSDRHIHQHHIHYWCNWSAPEDEGNEGFGITHLIRSLALSSYREAKEWLS